MPDRLNLALSLPAIWLFYLACSVYGHVGFKLATQQDADFGLWKTLFSAWGVTATLAWGLSAVLWILILSKSTLLVANTTSSLSYALIVMAAALFFKEAITPAQWAGVALVFAGIYLVTAR